VSATSANPEFAEADRHRAIRNIIASTCLICLSFLLFNNGFLLLYLTKLGLSRETVLVLLAFPSIAHCLLQLPFAFLGDRYGKRRASWISSPLLALGFAGIILAGWNGLSTDLLMPILILGTAVFAIGYASYLSTWFALLSPIIPENVRGAFFGKLRFSWQAVGVLFVSIYSLFFSHDSELWVFQIILGVSLLALIIRYPVYRAIPELENTGRRGSFGEAFGSVLRADNYLPFCCYVFLLMLFVFAAPQLFNLIEKKVLNLGDSTIVWMGNLTMIGSVAGFALGGKAVDKLGTKSVFLGCHFGYSVVIGAFLFRDMSPLPLTVYVGALHFLFGVTYAASSIAISTEMLALVPKLNKSLATALCGSLTEGGKALSGIFSAMTLKLNILNEAWVFFGMNMSAYDSMLLACSVMVFLLVVALGLVPSVIRKSEWVPKMH
jgi:MFS family permease